MMEFVVWYCVVVCDVEVVCCIGIVDDDYCIVQWYCIVCCVGYVCMCYQVGDDQCVDVGCFELCIEICCWEDVY